MTDNGVDILTDQVTDSCFAFPMCVPFRIALTLVFRLDDGQAVSVADRIGSPADIPKVGFEVVPVFLAVNAGNGVEQHMIMQMVVVKVSRDHHLVSVPQKLPGKFHAQGMSLLRVTSPGA